MAIDSFLDTNIIVNYSKFDKNTSRNIIKKCYLYIKNKKGKFILCGAVLEELRKVQEKLSRLHKAVLSKIESPEYNLDECKIISKREIPFAKKLHEQFKNEEKEGLFEDFTNERALFEMKIDSFLKTSVDEFVIPIEQIKNELVNIIHDIIPNHADCKIVASALQFQTNRALFLFVTADSRDLDPNGYDYLKESPRLKDYKFPKLHNLMFTT